MPRAETTNGGGLILIVDDEEMVLRLTGIILERQGYKVLTAANGEVGVRRVSEYRDQLALVILDLVMPVMGGVEAFLAMRALAPTLPVILMTGYDASLASELFEKDALTGFIQKPGAVQELLQMVRGALAPGDRELN